MNLNELYDMAETENIIIDFRDFAHPIIGIYICDDALANPVIGLHTSLLTDERRLKCVLAEELGHHFTSGGNLVPHVCKSWNDNINVLKGESMALRWALAHLISDDELVCMLKQGLSMEEISDHFYVTIEFMKAKIELIKTKSITSGLKVGGCYET